MKLYLNGIELDANTEIELIKSENFGYNALIINNDDSAETRMNCHEIHHLYQSPFEPSIAFESDFHGTGGTRKIKDIKMVFICEAMEMSAEY